MFSWNTAVCGHMWCNIWCHMWRNVKYWIFYNKMWNQVHDTHTTSRLGCFNPFKPPCQLSGLGFQYLFKRLRDSFFNGTVALWRD